MKIVPLSIGPRYKYTQNTILVVPKIDTTRKLMLEKSVYAFTIRKWPS